jgi:aspartate carbamoyltransferase catalytic subunit
MYTIREFKGRLNNLKVMIWWDLQYWRTTHSLIKLLSLYENNQIYWLSRPEFQLPQEYIDFMKERWVSYTACENFDELPQDLDVLYHTRTQLERLPKEQQWKNIQEFIINKEVLDKFPNAILMHPLPRVNEITTDVDEDSRSVFFKQAENWLWVRMALLTKIFWE